MKKYYKFLFIALFGLFIFLPKDTFAKDKVIFYSADYTEVARCEGSQCSNGSFQSSGFGAIKRIRIIQDGYAIPADMKYSYFIDFSYGYPSSDLHNLGLRIGQDGMAWITPNWSSKLVDSYFTEPNGIPTHRYHVNANFTTINSGGEIAAEIDLGENVWLYNFTLYNIKLTATGSTTGDIVFNQTQELIENNNANTDKIIANENKNHKEDQETKKGIWETIKELPSKFMDMLKSLFIPEDDYFKNKFDELTDNITGVLGFLAYPFTLIVDTFEFFMTVEDTGSYIIKWPDIPVPNFEEHNIIEAGQYDLGQLLTNDKIAGLRNIAFVFINALLLLAFLQLCKNQYNRVFGGDVSETEFISVAEEYDIDYKTGEVSNIKHIEKKTTRRDIN